MNGQLVIPFEYDKGIYFNSNGIAEVEKNNEKLYLALKGDSFSVVDKAEYKTSSYETGVITYNGDSLFIHKDFDELKKKDEKAIRITESKVHFRYDDRTENPNVILRSFGGRARHYTDFYGDKISGKIRKTYKADHRIMLSNHRMMETDAGLYIVDREGELTLIGDENHAMNWNPKPEDYYYFTYSDGKKDGIMSWGREIILKPEYKSLEGISENRFIGKTDSAYYIIDLAGNRLNETPYSGIRADKNGNYPVHANWGYEHGLLGPDLDYIVELEGDYRISVVGKYYVIRDVNQNLYNIIDKHGIQINKTTLHGNRNEPSDDQIRSLLKITDQLFYSQKDSKISIVKANGEPLVNQEFKNIESLSEHYFNVEYLDGTYSLINMKGEQLFEPIPYIIMEELSENYFQVTDSIRGKRYSRRNSEILGLIDQSGKLIIPIEHTIISNNSSYQKYGFFYVRGREGKYGVYDKDGEIVMPVIYKSISLSKDVIDTEFHYFQAGGQSYDMTGNKIDPDRIIRCGEFYNPLEDKKLYYQAYKNGKMGLINESGKIIIPFENNSIVQRFNNLKVRKSDIDSYYKILSEDKIIISDNEDDLKD